MYSLRSLVAAAALFALVTPAQAEEARPNPQQQAVKSLIGKWSGKGSIVMEGKTHAVTMTWDCADAAAGTGARCHGVILGIPGFTYTFDDLWAWSPADGLVHWFTVTNAGEVHDHRGHLDAGGGLVQVELPMDGKLFSEVVTFKRRGKALTMSWMTTVGGTMRERGSIDLTMK